MGKRHIKDSVRHELYARSGNQCAFPGCSSLLFEDGKNGKANKGKICHIEGLNPESARYNPSSTDDERNSIDNLILLCANHHELIDQNPERYTVGWLRKIKAEHETQIEQSLTRNGTKEFFSKLQLIFQKCRFDEILLTQSFDAPFPEWYIESFEEGYMRIRDLLNEQCSLAVNKKIKKQLYGFTQLSEHLLSCVAICYTPNGNGTAVPARSCNRDDLETILENCRQVQKIYKKFRYD